MNKVAEPIDPEA